MTDTPDPSPAEQLRRVFTGERAGMAALAVSVLALAIAAAPYLTGGAVGGQGVRAYLLRHPEVLQEISDALQAKAQQQQVADDKVRAGQITQRAQAQPALLAVDAGDPAFGPADAKVTVIEFFDFRCPGCKATAPEVLALMQAHPDVHFVFKDWPILDRNGDDVSHYAARAADAAHRQGKYLPVFRALMAAPGLTKEGVDRILAANGVAMDDARQEMAATSGAQRLANIHASASALGLIGTPTFFVNGRATDSIQPQELEKAIQAAKRAA